MSHDQKEIQRTMNQFVGKTIERVQATAVNFWVLFFTDGSSIGLEVEHFGGGLHGIIPTDDR